MPVPHRVAAFAAVVLGVALFGAAVPSSATQDTGPSAHGHPLGRPLTVQVSPEQYDAAPQNWAAAQDQRGIVYVANSNGVLEYDGHDWRLLRLGEGLAARSLAVGTDGRVYVGADGDFGELRPTSAGDLRFRSLAAEAGLDVTTVGAVTAVASGPLGTIFQSATGVFVWQNGRLTVLRPHQRFDLGFGVRHRFFVREDGRGLFELRGGALVFVDGSERFASDPVFTMLPVGTDRTLIGSRDGGFSWFTPDASPRERFSSAIEFAALARDVHGKRASAGGVLPDGRVVVGTLRDGLYITRPDGRVQDHLHRAAGLIDDAVLGVYASRRGNLVVCLEGGLTFVETAAPFRVVAVEAGIRGAGRVAFRRTGPTGSSVYLGTSRALFVRAAEAPRFSPVEGSHDTWALLEARGRLLLAHGDGVADVDGSVLRPVFDNGGPAFALLAPKAWPDRLLVGTGTGLRWLTFDGPHWRDGGMVTGFQEPVRDIVEDGSQGIWVGTQAGGALYRVALGANGSVASARRYTTRDGLPSDTGVRIATGSDAPLFGTVRGVYRYNAGADRFEPDPRYSDTHRPDGRVRLLRQDPAGDVFVLAGDAAHFYRTRQGGDVARALPYLARLTSFRVGNVADALDDRSLLLGYRDGFIEADLTWNATGLFTADTMVRQVITPIGLLFSGHVSHDAPPPPPLAYEGNNVRFVFGAPFLEGAALTEYSHRLDGFDHTWSPWQRENTTAYTNLREGRYDFRVRARTVYGDTLDEASYRFTILPPWYRTGAAFFGFAAAAILGLFGMMRVNSRRLLGEKAHLEQRIAEQTRELREASLSDELTGLRNRRFVTEVVLTEFQAFVSFKQSLLRLAEKGRPLPERAGTVFACFLCDLDHFKRVNDEYGHETGDLVLKQVAHILKASAREDDYVVRWGGEEFLVVLKYTDTAYVPVFAEKIRRAVAEARFRRSDTARQPLGLTISIGYSLFPFYEDTPQYLSFEQTVQLADLAMYAAKGRGRNQAVGVGRGSVRLPEADVESCLADLSSGLAKGYLSVTPEVR